LYLVLKGLAVATPSFILSSVGRVGDQHHFFHFVSLICFGGVGGRHRLV
jgi:hypothetical protein